MTTYNCNNFPISEAIKIDLQHTNRDFREKKGHECFLCTSKTPINEQNRDGHERVGIFRTGESERAQSWLHNTRRSDNCGCTFSRATATVRICIPFSSKIFVQPQLRPKIVKNVQPHIKKVRAKLCGRVSMQPQLSQPPVLAS